MSAGPRVLLLSGPNLNLLGERQPHIYGTATLEEHVAAARFMAERCGVFLDHVQSNAESGLVEAIHAARGRCQAIIINAGALTHYGWSIADSLAAFDGVVIELHLSNPSGREPWRRISVLAAVADGTIAGFGGLGYELAILAVARMLEKPEP